MLHASLEALLCIIAAENKKFRLKYARNLFGQELLILFVAFKHPAKPSKNQKWARKVFAIEVIFVNS